MLDRLLAVLKARFGSAPALSEAPRGVDVLADMADRRVMRRYLDKPVDPALLETLCAVALSAPSKSDLQQADIVIVSDKGQREKLEALLPDNPWVKAAPVFLVFCGNNRRHRLLFEWRGRPFVNDYLDPFFNAAVDTGIVLATFVAAADRAGLGSCPISAIRNHAAQVSDILGLPQHVFPVAALGVGWPSFEGVMSPRLGLDITIHRDRYDAPPPTTITSYPVTSDARRPLAPP
ncbi:MAG TPA: nitroreductase family protein, partial [Reyranella sp.]|nr:nitroreductase family protein [Reyranella sp.]